MLSLTLSLDTNGQISTGSTLIKWGDVLKSTKIGEGAADNTLHEWFKKERQVSPEDILLFMWGQPDGIKPEAFARSA